MTRCWGCRQTSACVLEGSEGCAAACGATTTENQNGVIIKLRSTTQGVQLNLSLGGITLKVTN